MRFQGERWSVESCQLTFRKLLWLYTSIWSWRDRPEAMPRPPWQVCRIERGRCSIAARCSKRLSSVSRFPVQHLVEGILRLTVSSAYSHQTGYAQIQGTKPQTLQYGLSDSPLAMVTWLRDRLRIFTEPGYPWDPESVITWCLVSHSRASAPLLEIETDSCLPAIHHRRHARPR